MKAFFITSGTNETHKHHESFACLPDNEVRCYQYHYKKNSSTPSGDVLDSEIYKAAGTYDPDLIVYVGAVSGNIPSQGLFLRLKNEIAPTVHLCSDAADEPWWPLLKQYDAAHCFSVQVALDGSKLWPLAETQVTALTVLDNSRFPLPLAPHCERSVVLGFAGNMGGTRTAKIDEMRRFGLQLRLRDKRPDGYDSFVEFMCRCRMTVNFPQTGSGRCKHVKGRVIESALSGVLLFEESGSPASEWFEPGLDYIEFNKPSHVRTLAEYYQRRPDESQVIAERLARKVRRDHGPLEFWSRIFERIPGLMRRAEERRLEGIAL